MSPVTSCGKIQKAVMTSDNNISTWENSVLMELRAKLSRGKSIDWRRRILPLTSQTPTTAFI
jgi:hypothetical protein